MKFVEKTSKPQIEKWECPNCGGELKHRTEMYDGYITSDTGEVQHLYTPTDDYVCQKCGKVFVMEEE